LRCASPGAHGLRLPPRRHQPQMRPTGIGPDWQSLIA
jgi:hypothetical protein